MKIFLAPSDQSRNLYHGGSNEMEQCWKIAVAARDALKSAGHNVRLEPYGTDMYARVRAANSWGAQLYVAIHTNAYNGTVRGAEVFTDYTSNEYAKRVHNAIMAIYPGPNRGVKIDRSLYEVGQPNCPAMLTETGFHDNPTDSAWIKGNTAAIGRAIAAGIIGNTPPQPPKPPQPPTPGDKYTVVKGDTLWGIAARLLGSGLKWQEIATANGITAKIKVGQKLTIPGWTTPKPPTPKPIKVGDKVKFNGTHDYNGTKLDAWTNGYVFDVIEVSGTRIVIGKGKAVTAAVRLSDVCKDCV